jgi:hypothetical protein
MTRGETAELPLIAVHEVTNSEVAPRESPAGQTASDHFRRAPRIAVPLTHATHLNSAPNLKRSPPGQISPQLKPPFLTARDNRHLPTPDSCLT